MADGYSTLAVLYIVGRVHHFDPRLFDLLSDLTASLNDTGGEIDAIYGYRTPETNEFLRTRSANLGVAVHRLRRGGVGYYRESNFVHVDVGNVRR